MFTIFVFYDELAMHILHCNVKYNYIFSNKIFKNVSGILVCTKKLKYTVHYNFLLNKF